MSRLTRLKLVLAAVGVGIWAVGARLGDDRITWAGLALLAGAFLLRFLNPRDRL